MEGSGGRGYSDWSYVKGGERVRCAITKAVLHPPPHARTHTLHSFSQLVNWLKSTAHSVEAVQMCNIYCTLAYAVVTIGAGE
jgi:hypothetical protein